MARKTTTKAASRPRKTVSRSGGSKRATDRKIRKPANRAPAKAAPAGRKTPKPAVKAKPPKSFTFSKKLERAKQPPGKVESARDGAKKPATGPQAKGGGAGKIESGRSRKSPAKLEEKTAAEMLEGTRPDKDGYVVFKGRRVRVISTKNVKKRRPLSAAARAEQEREQQAQNQADKPIVTKLSKKDLDHYRDLLLLLRSQKLGDLSAKEAEALQSNGGNLSHMPIHMADIGTDAYEQDFTLGLAESDRKLIREIDDALARIENKTYGMCLLTRKPIPKSRLNAKPWAKYTVEAARMIENGQVA